MNKMKQNLIFIGIGIVVMAVLGVVGVINSYGLDTIVVHKDQIDKVIKGKLPIKKRAFIYDITVANADLDLSEGTLGVLVNIEIKKTEVDCSPLSKITKWKKAQKFLSKLKDKCEGLSPKTHKIDVFAVGSLTYQRPQFHFSPNSPEDVKIQTEFTDALLIRHKPVIDAALQKIVFKYLNNFPVFKFNNTTKQTIISMAIESVEVHEDYLQVNVSYLAFTKVLMGYVIVLLIFCVIAFGVIRSGMVSYGI